MVDFVIDDLAIIFEPFINDNGDLFFRPIDVVEGSYDERIEAFVDYKLNSYPHLMDCEMSKGFAFRISIDELIKSNPDKDIEYMKASLLEEYGDFDFFLVEDKDGVTLLCGENKKENKNIIVVDRDLKNYLVSFIGIENEEDIIDFIKSKKADAKPIEEVKEKEEFKIDINPHLLLKEIKETIKGQDNAIKEIVTMIWENYNSDRANNFILVGSSGTGKTEILRQLSKKIDVPLLITAVTGLSQAGYVGGSTEDILASLLSLTKGDIERAEHGIVVLDELDKLAYTSSESGKVSTMGVQDELLKIVEDGIFNINYNYDGFPSKVIMNTRNITFIGAGAFDGMLTIRKDKSMGFNSDISTREIKKEKVLDEDLIKYGLKPELVGRMGKIIKLNDLDINAMKEIIKSSNESAYLSKKKLINKKGIRIDSTLEESIIEEIANVAVSKKIGARAITGIVNEMFSDILFEISNPEEKYSELEISKETVNNPKKYVLRK